MTYDALASTVGLPLATAVAGLAFGLVYFAALRRTVVLFAAQRSWIGPVALTVARIAAAVILLGIAARLGAAPLLAAFIGFLLARAVVLHSARRVG
jgi:F1-F0 ATPase (N-ATPase) AtpR subunit